MSPEQPISVSSVWEEHSYLSEQRCSCGGHYKWLKWVLNFENEQRLEVADAKCISCGNETQFWFEVSGAFENHSRSMTDIQKAWPAPHDGPYRVNETEYRKAVDSLIVLLEAGTLSQGEVDHRLRKILDEYYPKIAGRFQVFGSRRGSMGISYLCVDTEWSPESSRPNFVVCKTIDHSPDNTLIEALKSEARLWLDLGTHSNVVQLLDVIATSPSRLILTMEAILPGPLGMTTLKEWIDAGLVELPLGIRFFHALCRAMAYCQRRVPGFVHGDLKPENLLVDTGYVLKVTDFGLAHASGSAVPHLGRSFGTPLYLAPECWEGEEASEKSDVYAVGMIVYEMFTGKHPFEHEKDIELLKSLHLRQHVKQLVNPLISDPIRNLLVQCLAKDASKRPTFADLLSGLGIDESLDVASESAETAAEWNNKGKALGEVGEHQKAIEYYMQALSLDPGNTVGWTNFAISLSRLGYNDRAERAYRICLGFGDTSAATLANYAAHILRAGNSERFEEALSHCAKSLELDPESLVALINKAALLNSLGRYSEAAQVAEAATKIDPAHPHIWVELGTAYWKTGRRSKAIKCAKKARRLDPTFEPARTLRRLIENTA